MKKRLVPELVIFDFDGTLIDSSADIAWVANATLKKLGYPEMTPVEIKAAIGWGVKSLLERLLPAEPPERIEEARRVFMDFYEGHLTVETRPYPGVERELRRLRGLGKSLAIVTNKPIAFTEKTLVGLSMEGGFDVVLGGDSLPKKKPDPAPILHVMDSLGVSAEKTVFVGDSAVDCEAGRAAGVVTVGAVYGFRGRAELADAGCDFLIDSFGELEGIII